MVPHPADALIGISLSSFIAGERSFAILFEPGDRRSLQSFFWNNGKLIFPYLVNLDPRFEMFTPDRQEWTRRALDTLPTKGTIHLGSLDAECHETKGEVLKSSDIVEDPTPSPTVTACRFPVRTRCAPRKTQLTADWSCIRGMTRFQGVGRPLMCDDDFEPKPLKHARHPQPQILGSGAAVSQSCS
ncbi:hypothetical protein [Mesorhizobium sp. M0239]|uniref:hypothetical protein n=1 Tax=Mesorhizobium sp. M0239 TaxID=2956924 RepID=UPI00333A9AA5